MNTLIEDVEDLVVTPFREIVEKGKSAIGNAGDHEPMQKAAIALVKEGERALKRIEPLCKKNLDDYGANFVSSLKENDQIASYRSELTELLWEFDDFTEEDSFEPEKFMELQQMSRKAAPKIYDILMRMKLEVPVRDDQSSSRGSVGQLPTPTSPQLHDIRHIEDATRQLRNLMASSPNFEGDQFPQPTERPPPPPSENPWDVHARPTDDSRTPYEIDEDRRAAMAESPVLPLSPLTTDYTRRFTTAPPPPVSANGGLMEQRRPSHEDRPLSSISTSSAHTFGHPRGRPPTVASTVSYTIPENDVSDQYSSVGPASPHSQRSRGLSFTNHAGDGVHGEYSRPDMDNRDSYSSYNSYTTSRPAFTAPGFSPAPNQAPPVLHSALQGPAGLEVVPTRQPPTIPETDYGPIPVESEMQDQDQAVSPESIPRSFPSEDCAMTSDCSFQLAKGFCDGAKEVVRGGVGVKRTKKPVGFASAATVARCISCLYDLDFGDIETDVDKKDKGNYTKSGINYRVRFLQKSHLSTKRVDDVQYGCVFCVQADHLVDPSDATVFFSQKTLFEHLARHSRPLPKVQGITVIEGDSVPSEHHNDYDVHFRKPPQPHPAKEKAMESAQLPSAVTREQARRLYGQRLLYDRTPALELAQGATITGITWPPQYIGEWAFGWHDGTWASVPTDVLRLNPPPRNQIKYDGTSLVRAKSRWKFAQKDKDSKGDWLKFDKNETISNLSWSYHEHWCWTGTNAKGKSGIFPSVFIDPDTLQTPNTMSSNRANSVHEEKNRSMSMLSVFTSRKASTTNRPPSIAESNSSHGTATSNVKPRKFAQPGDFAGS